MPSVAGETSKSLGILQDTIGPEFQGIIWITSEPFHKLPHPFYSLDYFFDGIMAQNLQQTRYAPIEKRIFFSQCFGHPFFLAPIYYSNVKNKNHLKEVFDIAKNIQKENEKILIIESLQGNISNLIKDQYPEQKFVVIRIE